MQTTPSMAYRKVRWILVQIRVWWRPEIGGGARKMEWETSHDNNRNEGMPPPLVSAIINFHESATTIIKNACSAEDHWSSTPSAQPNDIINIDPSLFTISIYYSTAKSTTGIHIYTAKIVSDNHQMGLLGRRSSITNSPCSAKEHQQIHGIVLGRLQIPPHSQFNHGTLTQGGAGKWQRKESE